MLSKRRDVLGRIVEVVVLLSLVRQRTSEAVQPSKPSIPRH